MSSSIKLYRLENLDCAHCAAKMQAGLEKLSGVQFANVNYATATLHLQTNNFEKAIQLVKNIDPNVRVQNEASEENVDDPGIRKELRLIGISTVLFTVGLLVQPAWHNSPFEIGEYIIFISAYLISGWDVLASAGKNIWRRNWFDETFLMSIATLGAIIIHELPEAVAVMLFYKIGELVQGVAVGRSRRSIRSLLALRSKHANLKIGDGVRKVTPESVKVGAEILILPGEKIPLDGIVIAGNSEVDTSTLTGESVPRNIEVEHEALAGMINKTGVLTLQVTKTFDKSAISKLLEMVQNANERKARTEKFITRFANIYTPFIVALALGVAFLPPLLVPGSSLSAWSYRALVLLVIACPCALLISIPLGYFGGVGGAARRGILVKGANILDVLAGVKTVVFDKTGTLTKGVFRVNEIVAVNGYKENDLLRIASEVERNSNHPIARAIRDAAKDQSSVEDIDSFEEIPGYGIVAKLNGKRIVIGNDALLHRHSIEHEKCDVNGTAVHVAIENEYAGYIVVSDELKEDAFKAIKALSAIGIKDVVMLTGDRQPIASAVANKIGVREFHAELLPEQKVDMLEEIMKNPERGKVAFVGDGINDAPVIARADVGISMGNLGSDAAIETSDVVLMTDAPSKVAEAIMHARRTRRIVWQNVGVAFGAKFVFITLGIMGLAGMWEAVFADVGVTLLAVLNATRVLK